MICTRWPEEQIIIPGIQKAGKVTLLGINVPVKTRLSGGRLSIIPPSITPATNPCDHAWVFKLGQALK
jgi:alpha-L-fucosidase